MGERKLEEGLEAKVERLLQLAERNARDIARLLNREEHAKRAAELAGPTTPEAEAYVAKRLKKWAGK